MSFTLRQRSRDRRAAETPVAQKAGGDFTSEAISLFSNLQRSATFAAGITVPLGFFASPKLSKEDSRQTVRMKHMHYLISAASLSSHLIAIVYSTIALNKLAEVRGGPCRSVVELLVRDYELPWVGGNVHFLLGLLSTAAALITHAQLCFGAVARPASFMVMSVMLQMIAVANAGIGQGEGLEGGLRFASNFPHLILVYLRLLLAQAVASRSIMNIASLGLGVTALVQVVMLLVRKDAPDESERQ